jgi:hypothetical protein
MTESLQENRELSDEEKDLFNLKRNISFYHNWENNEDNEKKSPYAEMIENQKSPLSH